MVYLKNILFCLIFNFLFSNISKSAPIYWTNTSVTIVGLGSSITSPTGPASTTDYIVITGTFLINADFTITDYHIRMAPGAQISSTGQHKLTLNNCHLHSDDGINMWKGFESSDPFAVNMVVLEIMGGTLIEDAETAIYIESDGKVIIHDSQLNKNYINIDLNNVGSSPSYSDLEIYNTLISCYSTASNPSSFSDCLLAPHPGRQTEIGIRSLEVFQTNVGDPSQGANTFDYLLMGIVNYSGNLTVKNNVFKNCGGNGGFCIFFENWYAAIFPVPLNLVVGGTATNEGNNFVDGRIAIMGAYDCNVEVVENHFENFLRGVDIINSTRLSVLDFNISTNTFFNCQNGIIITDVKPNSGRVNGNHFNDMDDLTYNNQIAISFKNPTTNTGNTTILSNTIFNYMIGISVEKFITANNAINDNYISYQNSAPVNPFIGIQIRNSQLTSILRNRIIQDHFYIGMNFTGIKCQNLNSADVMHNSIINTSHIPTSIGMHIYGNCTGSNFWCNSLALCYEGIRTGIGTPAVMTDQGSPTYASDNTWSDSFIYPPAARISGTSNAINWYFQGISSLTNPYYPQTTNASITLVPEINAGCAGRSNFKESHVDVKKDLYPILFEKYSFDKYNEEYQYTYKTIAFEAFLSDPSLLNHSTECENFYNKYYSENLGQLERIESSLFNHTSSIEDYKGDLETLSNISPDNLIEKNKIIYLSIFLKSVIEGTRLGSQDSIDLNEIACFNSIAGGEAVSWARSFLDLEIDDENGCGDKISSKGKTGFNSENFFYSIYPNPSNGSITLGYNSDEKALATIYDMSGNIIWTSENLYSGETVDLKLNSGYYYYNVSLANGTQTERKKLVIIK